MNKDLSELDDIFRKEAFDHYSNGLESPEEQLPTLKKRQLNVAFLFWMVLVVALVVIVNYPLQYRTEVTGEVRLSAGSWYLQIPSDETHNGAEISFSLAEGTIAEGTVNAEGKVELNASAIRAKNISSGQQVTVDLITRKSILEEFFNKQKL